MMVSRPRTRRSSPRRGRGDALLVTGVGRAGGLFRLLLEVLAGGLLADLARLGLGLVPLVLFALALVGLFALLRPLLVGDDWRAAVLLAFSRSTASRWRESASARMRASFSSSESCGSTTPTRRPCASRLAAWGRESRRFAGRALAAASSTGCGRSARADRPALLLLDQNGLRAPMAEALPHMAGFHRPAHVERHLAPSASGFAFGLVSLAHSSPYPIHSGLQMRPCPCGSALSARPPRGRSEPLRPG